MSASSSSFRIGLSQHEEIAKEVAGEIANTLGIYGRIVLNSVKEQHRLMDEIKKVAKINEKNEVCMPKGERDSSVDRLIDEYNENCDRAKKYQYYLNIQKEALGFRGFDYDPYNIMPRVKK